MEVHLCVATRKNERKRERDLIVKSSSEMQRSLLLGTELTNLLSCPSLYKVKAS